MGIMADFLIADKLRVGNEGGYANVVGDRGGETWRGIARKAHPKWEGWKIIDSLRNKQGFPIILNENKRLQELELEFYKVTFWDVIKGDKLKHQEVANVLYDSAVNMGPKQAVKLAQRAAGIKETGVVDAATLKTLNK